MSAAEKANTGTGLATDEQNKSRIQAAMKNDEQREKISTIFADKDAEFVKDYLSARIEALGHTMTKFVSRYWDKADDIVPSFDIYMDHEVGAPVHQENNFISSLKQVFQGHRVIHQETDGSNSPMNSPSIQLNLRGNAPRLAADIIENDRPGMAQMLEKLTDDKKRDFYKQHIASYGTSPGSF